MQQPTPEEVAEAEAFAAEQAAWDERQPEEGECHRCGGEARLEFYVCKQCDQTGTESDPVYACEGHIYLSGVGQQGEDELLECENCGSTDLDATWDTICDYCEHMTTKDD